MKLAAILFCAAAVPRIAYLLIFHPRIESQYWGLSESLMRTGTFTIDGLQVTDFEPLYPLFLAGARLIAGESAVAVQLIQIALASAGAVLLFRLTRAQTGSPRAGVIAGLLFAAYPLLIRHAATMSDSSLTTVLLIGFAAASAALFRKRGRVEFYETRKIPPDPNSTAAVIAGLWLGLSVLSRAMVLPLVPIVGAILAWRGRVRDAVAVTTVATLVILPWWIRNHSVNGSWWLTRSGINLFIGNSPYTAALLPEYDLDLLEAPAYDLASAARPDIVPGTADYIPRIDAYFTHASIEHMKASPFATVAQKFRNALYFLSPRLSPHYVSGPETRVRLEPPDKVFVEDPLVRPRSEVFSHTLAASFVMAAAAIGVYLRRRVLAQDAVLWAIVGVFVLVYAIYVPATRYRAPMEFAFLFYAGVALEYATKRRDAV